MIKKGQIEDDLGKAALDRNDRCFYCALYCCIPMPGTLVTLVFPLTSSTYSVQPSRLLSG